MSSRPPRTTHEPLPRLFDLARANLNALLDKSVEETSVDELTDAELEAELERRRERRRREENERRDREAAERAAERAAKRTGQKPSIPRTRNAPKPPPRRPAPPVSASERRLRELYAQLEVPYGAGFDEVKKSFRRLMRKYHPDLHAGNPVKHRTATQLTMLLTQAYNELEIHLTGGPNGKAR